MRLSEGRISHLAHRILDVLSKEGLIEVESHRHALGAVKRALEHSHDEHDRIDAMVRRKIDSLSRRVPPGSREWDILYQKYFAEALHRQKS